MTSDQKQEFTLKITQANKTELVVILYEMTLIYIMDAKNMHTLNRRKEFQKEIKNARGCIEELLQSLNLEFEIAKVLFKLYLYISKLLACADARNKREPLEEIEVIITHLKEAYQEVSKNDQTGSIMKNTQTVYAGLTYGKSNLNENLSDQGGNRGFLI